MIHYGRAPQTAVGWGVLFLCMLFSSCAADPVGPTLQNPVVVVDPGVVFIPDFTFTWQDQSNKNHTFLFLSSDFGKSSGAITGSERVSTTSSDLTGTFNQRNVTFVVKRTKGPITFTAMFTDKDTMTATSTDGTITLIRIKT